MERPTHARYVVLGLTLLLSAIVYLDRVAISTTAGGVKLGLGLSDKQLGWVFSAYTFAYALFEIPSGWLADRYGARWMLTRIVVAWSVMTAATGAAAGIWSLLLVRFLFGLGEAGAFPAMARVHGRWLPTEQRGRSFGLLVMAGLLGSAFTQPLVVAMLTRMSWRWVFPIFGSVGLAWAVIWLWWFRDDPHRHRGVNATELALIGAQAETAHERVPWAALVRSSTVWILCLMYLGVIYGWYFYLTWLPQYLQRARNFDLRQTGWFAMLPLIGIALGVLSGGWVSDLLVSRFGERWGRRLPGAVGLPLAAVAIVSATVVVSPQVAVLALTMAAMLAAWGVAPGWAVCIDIGGRHAGVVSGTMNTFGNLGGALCSLVFGYCLDHWHSWSTPLWSMAALYMLAGLCWTRVDAGATLKEGAMG